MSLLNPNAKVMHGLFFGLRIVLLLLLPLALLWLFQPAVAVSFWWDWANSVGYLAALLCLVLFVYAGRPKSNPPFKGRFFYNIHRDLGVAALVFTSLHIGVLLCDDALVLEHMKYTAPRYMLAGLLAAVLLLVLGLFSGRKLRLKLWRDYRLFQSSHLVLSLLLLILLAWHLIGASFYLNHALKQMALFGLLTFAMVDFFRHRHRNAHIPGKKLDVSTWSWPLAGAVMLIGLFTSWYLIAWVGAYEA